MVLPEADAAQALLQMMKQKTGTRQHVAQIQSPQALVSAGLRSMRYVSSRQHSMLEAADLQSTRCTVLV